MRLIAVGVFACFFVPATFATPLIEPVVMGAAGEGSALLAELLGAEVGSGAAAEAAGALAWNPAVAAAVIAGGLILWDKAHQPMPDKTHPAGWSFPIPPAPPPTIPATDGGWYVISLQLGGNVFNTAADACIGDGLRWATVFGYNYPNNPITGSPVWDAASQTCTLYRQDGSSITITASYTSGLHCPSGYVLSGGDCVASDPNPRNPVDGVRDSKVGPNGSFVQDPYDGDPMNSPLNNQSSYTMSGIDSAGFPVEDTVSVNANGGLDVTQKTQYTDGTGQSNVSVNQVAGDSAGNVTYITHYTVYNTTINNVATPAVPTSPGTGGNPSPQPTIDTSNLAKESTLSLIKTDLETFMGQVGEFLHPTAPGANTIPPGGTPSETVIKPEDLPSLGEGGDGSLGAAAACPSPISFTVLGASLSFSFDPMCTLAVQASYFVLAGAWMYALKIVFSAISQSGY